MSSTGARAGTARGLSFGGEGDGRRATIATPPSRHYLNDDNYATDEIIFDDRRQPAPRGSPAPPTEPTPGARRPPKPTPWLGYLILAGCFAGFGYSLYITPGILAPLAVNPLIGPTSDSLVKSGAKVVCLINGPQQQWWRLVSPMCVCGMAARAALRRAPRGNAAGGRAWSGPLARGRAQASVGVSGRVRVHRAEWREASPSG